LAKNSLELRNRSKLGTECEGGVLVFVQKPCEVKVAIFEESRVVLDGFVGYVKPYGRFEGGVDVSLEHRLFGF
jgi:hypothetical protein